MISTQGKATHKRLILCLATLAANGDVVQYISYLDHVSTLCASGAPQFKVLGLEMLLALGNPANEEDVPEDFVRIIEVRPHVRDSLPQVLNLVQACTTLTQNTSLVLEALYPWLRFIPNSEMIRLGWPLLFDFVLTALSDANIAVIRAAAPVVSALSDLSLDITTKDELMKAVIRARGRFSIIASSEMQDEDPLNAIACTFAKVGEANAFRYEECCALL